MKKFDVAALGSGNIDIFYLSRHSPLVAVKLSGHVWVNKLAAQSPTVPVRWDNWVSMWYLFHVWAMIIQPRSFLMDLKNIM